MRYSFVVLPLLACSVVSAQAQDFGPLDHLSGACWVAEVPSEGEAPAAQNIHCFEKMFGGQFIRDRHEFVSEGAEPITGESVYALEDTGFKITNYSDLGSIEQAHASVSESGELVFQVSKKIRSILQVIDADSYELRQEERKGGSWNIVNRQAFTRQP